MIRLIPLLLLLVACSDVPLRPSNAESIEIELEAQRVSETTLLVGQTVRLSATFRQGGKVEAGREVRWTSEDRAIATVDDDGAVRGEQFGSTRIIASAGSARDTIGVSILAAAMLDSDCTLSGAAVRLQVGESYTSTAAAVPVLCVEGGATNSQFLLIPFHAATSAQRLTVEITSDRIAPVMSSGPSFSIGAHAALEPADVGSEFDRRLRDREARELGPLVRPAEIPLAPRFNVSGQGVPALGDTLLMNVNAGSTCTSPTNRKAVVAAVGGRSVVLADVENPTGGFSAADYEGFAREFDEVVFPTVTMAFGAPTDIDGNSRVLILFTRAVNELTDGGSDSYVAGFFYARDLFPRSDAPGFRACSASNSAELLYMLVPDPTGEVNGNKRSREFVGSRTAGVLAHELQHLISASRRLRVHKFQSWNEDFWLNEGLSHIAEELAFYAASPFRPGQGAITIQSLRDQNGGLEAFNRYQASNFSRFAAFLRRPEAGSPFSGSGLATRGSSWAFLRYAADRRGGSENELWSRLIDSDAVGYANLMQAIGSSPLDWMHDWLVSLYAEGLVEVPARFREASWSYRSIMPTLSANAGSYPLKVVQLQSGVTAAHFEVESGSGGFARFTVRAGERGRIAITSGGAPAPSKLRFTLVRTR